MYLCVVSLILFVVPVPQFQDNVREVFETATRAGLASGKRKGGTCMLL